MKRIANTHELTAALKGLLAEASGPNPSRHELAAKLAALSVRVAGSDRQPVMNVVSSRQSPPAAVDQAEELLAKAAEQFEQAKDLTEDAIQNVLFARGVVDNALASMQDQYFDTSLTSLDPKVLAKAQAVMQKMAPMLNKQVQAYSRSKVTEYLTDAWLGLQSSPWKRS